MAGYGTLKKDRERRGPLRSWRRSAVIIVASCMPFGGTIAADTKPTSLHLLQASITGKSVNAIVQTRNSTGESASIAYLRMTAEIDGKPVPLNFVQDEHHTAIVMLIDISRSVRAADFALAVRIGHRLVQSLGPNDRMAIVSAGSTVRTVIGFTGDQGALSDALLRLAANDQASSLFVGLARANAIANATDSELPLRRVIVNLTDGVPGPGDNAAETADLLSAQPVPVYGVLLPTSGPRRDTGSWGTLVAGTHGVVIPAQQAWTDAGFERLRGWIEGSFRFSGVCNGCAGDGSRMTVRVRTATQDASLVSGSLSVAGASP